MGSDGGGRLVMSSTVSKELETHDKKLQVSTGIDIYGEIWFRALHYLFVFSPSLPIPGLFAFSGEIIINLNACSLMHADALSETKMTLFGRDFSPESFEDDEDFIREAVQKTIIHEEIHRAIISAGPATNEEWEHFAMGMINLH